jgi:hypothetical protein
MYTHTHTHTHTQYIHTSSPSSRCHSFRIHHALQWQSIQLSTDIEDRQVSTPHYPMYGHNQQSLSTQHNNTYHHLIFWLCIIHNYSGWLAMHMAGEQKTGPPPLMKKKAQNEKGKNTTPSNVTHLFTCWWKYTK